MSGDISHEEALAAWQALREFLSQSEEGQAVLAGFTKNPQGEGPALGRWLKCRFAQLPSPLATYISGGHVDTLVNIANAAVVLIQQTLPPSMPTALYQLPPDIADFTGRVQEVADLMARFGKAREGTGTPVVITAVAGMPGVGKSALAIHAGHLLKQDFPDGQLYVDLRGAEGSPRDPSDVLAGFLRALGISDETIPKRLEERAALYRSRLHNRRAFVLLDNAHDEAQVKFLQPSGSTSAVLITSRRPLAELEGVAIIDLAVMSDAEAIELLTRVVGAERVDLEREAAKRVAAHCGRLPLALRIAGARLKGRRHRTIGQEANELAEERERLERLEGTYLDVRASFALSYRDLSESEARLFRLAAVMPGTEFGFEVTGALLGTQVTAAHELAERLVGARLLEVLSENRYRFHDLIRLFAKERLEQEESAQAQKEALLRAARWYAQASVAASGALDLLTGRAAAMMQPDSQTDPVVEPAQSRSALDWFQHERANLIGMAEAAHASEEWGLVLLLVGTLPSFFSIRSLWRDWERTHLLALEAAIASSNRPGEAQTLNDLGLLYTDQHRWDEAIQCHEQSLSIYRELGDRYGEGQTSNYLGNVCARRGRSHEAVRWYNDSLSIKHDLGDRQGEGHTLSNLGMVYREQGRWVEAIRCLEQSLSVFRGLGDRRGEGHSLGNIGAVLSDMGRWGEAIQYLQQSLSIKQQLDDRKGEGLTLNNLGAVYSDQGILDRAVQCFEQSLSVYRELGDQRFQARTLNNLVSVYLRQGRWDEAIRGRKQVIEIYSALYDRQGEANTLGELGSVYLMRGHWDEAIQSYEQSLAVLSELRDRQGEAKVLGNMGIASAQNGRWDEAMQYLQRSLFIFREIGDHLGEGKTLASIGNVHKLRGQLDLANAAWEQALAKLYPGSPEYLMVSGWLRG